MKVIKKGVILRKTLLIFENEGVLNPATIASNGDYHMFYRAVSKGNFSTISYCQLSHGLTPTNNLHIPLIFPQFPYESHGVEDPRIVKIDDLYYLTYTAYDGVNALGALATSKDLKTFDKKGIITAQTSYDEFKHLATCKTPLNEKYERYNNRSQLVLPNDKKILLWNKNVIFFPRRIDGQLYFLHRIKPDIQIASVDDIEGLTKDFWDNYYLHFCDNIVLSPKFDHEVSYIGGGCPPIETSAGWLVIYHAVHDTTEGYVYAACAALLDLSNPRKEISRLPYPLFKPEEEWELKGEVNNVCFPSGTLIIDDLLYIYYGAADECVACATVPMQDLLDELLKYRI